jgi:uncharacterized membrane protein
MRYAAGYLTSLAAFLLADMVWLSTMVSRVYRPAMGDLLRSDVNLPPAVVFYLLYPVGLLIFAINPALRAGSAANAALLGALLGLFTYGTYDLTNHATLRNWTLQLTLVDMSWGMALSAFAATAGFLVANRLAA